MYFRRSVSCATSNLKFMAKVLTAFGKWDSNSAKRVKHNSTPEWMKFHNYLIHSYITTFLSTRYYIIKSKSIFRMTWKQKIDNLSLPVYSNCRAEHKSKICGNTCYTLYKYLHPQVKYLWRARYSQIYSVYLDHFSINVYIVRMINLCSLLCKLYCTKHIWYCLVQW